MASSSSELEETPKTHYGVHGKQKQQLPPSASKKLTFRSESESESESEKGGHSSGGDDKTGDERETNLPPPPPRRRRSVLESENKTLNDEEIAAPSTGKKPASASLSSSLLFCEEDELILLTEMKNLKEKNNGEIKNDWVSFHQEVQHKLSKKFTKTQIAEKVRRLKNKFFKERNQSIRNKKKNEEDDQSLPAGGGGGHDARLYSLSISLWGNDDHDNIPTRKRKRAGSLSAEDNGGGDSQCKGKHAHVPKGQPLNPSDYPSLKVFFKDDSMPKDMRIDWTFMGSEAAQKLENQCSNIYRRELELYLELINLKIDVTRLISDQIHSV